MQLFQHFFLLLDSRLDLVELFKCMIWQSIFLLFFFLLFFSHSRGLSTSGNDTYHRWPFRLNQSCLYRFCPKRRLWLKSISEKWVIFDQHAQRHQSGWFQNITILGTYVFGHWKGFGRLEAVISLDAYQITNCQFLLKTYHFLLPDFRRIREISF